VTSLASVRADYASSRSAHEGAWTAAICPEDFENYSEAQQRNGLRVRERLLDPSLYPKKLAFTTLICMPLFPTHYQVQFKVEGHYFPDTIPNTQNYQLFGNFTWFETPQIVVI
jgi:hypothetical protein